jgi:hypothetical protein
MLALARGNKLDETIGRVGASMVCDIRVSSASRLLFSQDEEIRRLMQVLCRRSVLTSSRSTPP